MELKAKFKPDIYNYSISLGQNDTGPCELDKTLVDPSTGSPMSELDSTTYAYFTFVNNVINRVNQIGVLYPYNFSPDKIKRVRYYTLSYGFTSGNLPPGFSVHNQVTSRITIDSSYAHESGQWVENFAPGIGRIAKTAAHLTSVDIYEYMFGGGFLIPRMPRKLFSNIQGKYGLEDDKHSGLYAETYFNFGLDFHKYWIAAKLAWNTQLNVDDLKDQYYWALFGAYAAPVKELANRLEDLWENQPDYTEASLVAPDSENGKFFSKIEDGVEKDPLSELSEFRSSNFRFFPRPTQLLVLNFEEFRQIVDEFQALRNQIASQGVIEPSFNPEPGNDPEYEKKRLLKKIDYFLEPLKLSLFAQERYRLFARARHKFVTKNLSLPEAMHILSKWHELPDLAAQIEKVRTFDFDQGIGTTPNQLPPVDEMTLELAEEVLKTFPNEALIVASKAFITQVTNDRGFCLERDLQERLEAEIMGWSGGAPGSPYVVTDQARILVRDYAFEKGYLFFEPEATSVELDGVIEDSEWGKPKFDGRLNVAIRYHAGKGTYATPGFLNADSTINQFWWRHDPTKGANYFAFRFGISKDQPQMENDHITLTFISRVNGSVTYGYQALKISQNGLIPQPNSEGYVVHDQLLATISSSAPGALVESLRFTGPTSPSWKKGIRTIRGARGPRDTYG
jgi:hypothetical protein